MVRIVTFKLVFFKTVAATSGIVARQDFVIIPEVESVYLLPKSVDHRQAPLQAHNGVASDISKNGGYHNGIAVATGLIIFREYALLKLKSIVHKAKSQNPALSNSSVRAHRQKPHSDSPTRSGDTFIAVCCTCFPGRENPNARPTVAMATTAA